MFSVILYGRNDSHGYNLHKRAAISFNALAEVMSDPDDEILFVDYNTPDDHPTFPEAIHDTLTEKAKKVMRVLRVRPDQHVRHQSKTHLVALEAQSRNVALRRSNPRNRWILYTNTDMLLVPRNEKESLSDILGAIPDGFYQVPRFEIPEMLWEAAFDRRDPVGNLAKLRDWSVRFHLNQVVHNYMPMKYDALGDFQAALREDMFAIHGFDEDMILGWHCDSNLAARLALYRGRVDTLIDKLFGYHCDHTRVAAANNKGRATRMNDQDRFIWNVATPYVPAQAETWGWPDIEIEEIRLDRDTAYQRYIGRPRQGDRAGDGAVRRDQPANGSCSTISPTTCRTRCRSSATRCVTFPRSTNLMLVATRPDFVTQLRHGLEGHGLHWPDPDPRGVRGPAGGSGGRRAGAVRRAALVGRALHLRVRPCHPDGHRARARRPPDRADRQEAVEGRRAAVQAGGRDRGRDAARRAGAWPRRFIGVNVIYNKFWHDLHELRRRQHQSLLQPGPGRAAARGRIAQGKGIEIPGTPRPVSRACNHHRPAS